MVPTRYGPAPSAAPGPGQSEPRAFPKRAVLILCLGMLVNSYTLSSLFPYVGVMVKDLLDLETINEAGGCNSAAPAAAAVAAAETEAAAEAKAERVASTGQRDERATCLFKVLQMPRFWMHPFNCAKRLLRWVRGERAIVRPFLERLRLGKLDRFFRKENSDDRVAALDGNLVSLLWVVDHLRLGPFIQVGFSSR